jgi:hypothetical protein
MHEPDPASRVVPSHLAPPGAVGEAARQQTLQILMTEHWSLLSARSLVYTEAMSRTAIFVAALTGSVVALALVAQATDFGDGFTAFALVLLPVVFFLGFVTILRLGQVNWEDATWVQGMNRIRNAYLEMAPQLEQYFVTSKYDDDEGLLLSSLAVPAVAPQLQGFVAIPGVVAVLDSVVAGATAAVAALALGAGTAVTVVIGIGVFALMLAAFVGLAVWMVGRMRGNMVVRFPTPADRSRRR